MTRPLPTLGAALCIPDLAAHRDWLIAGQRDLELQDFIETDLLDGDWRDAVAAAHDLLGTYPGRLGIHGPFWGFAIDTRDPAVRSVVQHRLMQGLDVCAALRATHMVVHSPFTTWDSNNLPLYPTARADKIARTMATLNDAVHRAEDLGVTLVIENIEDKDPIDRVELARAFNSPAVAVSLDTGHAHYAHGTTGAPPVDYFVTAAGAHLAHVHIQDADGHADRHWAPGKGNVNWHAVFAALAAAPANPRLVLELNDARQIRAGADHLIGLGLAK